MKDADDRSGRTFTEIEAARSARGGFTRESFRELGVPYPPQKGWRQKLLQEARESGRERRPFKDALFSLCKAYGVDPDTIIVSPVPLGAAAKSKMAKLLEKWLTVAVDPAVFSVPFEGDGKPSKGGWLEKTHRFPRAHDDDDIPPF